LQYSLQPRLHLELGLLRLVHAGRLKPIEEALRELQASEKPRVAAPAPFTARSAQASYPATRAPQSPAYSRPATAPAQTATAPAGDTLRDRLIALLEQKTARLAVDAVRNSEIVEAPGCVEFVTTKLQSMGLRGADFEKTVAQAVGRAVKVTIKLTEGSAASGTPVPAASNPEVDAAAERALASPEVQHYQKLFPDSKVRGVRDLKE